MAAMCETRFIFQSFGFFGPFSGIFPIVFLHQGKNVRIFGKDAAVVFPLMGDGAMAAVLDSLGGIGKGPAAMLPQGIQGTIAKQAAEILLDDAWMTGEIFALGILEKTEACAAFFWHAFSSSQSDGRLDYSAWRGDFLPDSGGEC